MVKKILIIDDSPAFLMYIGLLLKRLNYRVIPCETGVESLRLLKLTEPDAVLLDLHMPSIDGLKILQHIRNDKQTASIPVIIVSHDSSSEAIEKCMNLGSCDFLTKPIKIDRLHDVLERCFYSHKGTNRKRLRERFVKKLVVTCRGNQFEFYAETLSEGGIYLRTRDPFPIGSDVELTLPLAEEDSLFLRGTVIYTKKLSEDFMNLPPGMAIQFKGLSDNDVRNLRTYVENLLAEDLLASQEERVIEKSQ